MLPARSSSSFSSLADTTILRRAVQCFRALVTLLQSWNAVIQWLHPFLRRSGPYEARVFRHALLAGARPGGKTISRHGMGGPHTQTIRKSYPPHTLRGSANLAPVTTNPEAAVHRHLPDVPKTPEKNANSYPRGIGAPVFPMAGHVSSLSIECLRDVLAQFAEIHTFRFSLTSFS